MRNFFLVVNKEKIYAYIVSVLTIVTLFFMADIINSEMDNTEVTSTNIIEENNVTNNYINSLVEN